MLHLLHVETLEAAMLSRGARELMAWCAAGCPLPGDEPRAEPVGEPFAPEAAGHASDMPEACIGALRDAEIDAPYLPWSAYVDAGTVRRLREELRATILELSSAERWPRELLGEIMTRAMRAPLADLVGNAAHFRSRLVEHRADMAAREVLARRAWRFDGSR